MIIRKLGLGLGALILFTGLAAAQTTMILGQVTDDGKPVQGALIKIKRQESSSVYKVKTDKKGKYVYVGLPLAKYDVSVEFPVGTVLDTKTNVKTSADREQAPEVNFDIKEAKAAQQASAAAAANGTQLSTDEARHLSAADRAALEKARKEQAEKMAKDNALNSAYGAGRTSLDQAEAETTSPADKATAYASAITSFKQAAELDPSQAVIWSHMAEAYGGLATVQAGPDQEASYQSGLDAWKKAIETTPDDPAFHNNYALLLAKAHKIDDAKTELQKAVDLDPPNAGKYYYNLGALLVNSGQNDAASDEFKKAITADPKYADAHYQYGVCLVGQAKTDAKGNIIPPPGTKEEFETYLTLTNGTGKFAQSAKDMLQTLGSQIQTTYTNPNAKKPAAKKKPTPSQQ